jgi:hypothetical protein
MSKYSINHWRDVLGLSLQDSARLLDLDLLTAQKVFDGHLSVPDEAARLAYVRTGVMPSSLTRPDREVSLAWDGNEYTFVDFKLWIGGKPLALLRKCFGSAPSDQLGDLLHAIFDAADAHAGPEFQAAVAEHLFTLAEATDRGILVDARRRFTEKHPALDRVFGTLQWLTGHGPKPLAGDTTESEPVRKEAVS